MSRDGKAAAPRVDAQHHTTDGSMRDTIKIAAAEAARPGITQRLGEFDATATHEPWATPS